jgi:hypothetical protein
MHGLGVQYPVCIGLRPFCSCLGRKKRQMIGLLAAVLHTQSGRQRLVHRPEFTYFTNLPSIDVLLLSGAAAINLYKLQWASTLLRRPNNLQQGKERGVETNLVSWNPVLGMNSRSLCSLAGRYNNPISTRYLASIDF